MDHKNKMHRLIRQPKNSPKKSRSQLTQRGIIAGKLKGQMPAQTPSGSLMLKVSIPCDTLETYSPICSVAIPQACSTTST